MNNYDPDWQYFGFFPLKFPSKKGLKLASSRHPPPLSGLPVGTGAGRSNEEEEEEEERKSIAKAFTWSGR